MTCQAVFLDVAQRGLGPLGAPSVSDVLMEGVSCLSHSWPVGARPSFPGRGLLPSLQCAEGSSETFHLWPRLTLATALQVALLLPLLPLCEAHSDPLEPGSGLSSLVPPEQNKRCSQGTAVEFVSGPQATQGPGSCASLPAGRASLRPLGAEDLSLKCWCRVLCFFC